MKVRERYGMTRFGQCCLLARRLVERGVRFVTINTFITVFDEITWDIHGSKPFTSIAGMKDIVAPMYDQGYTRLDRGSVPTRHAGQHDDCCLAEFGRTPKVNPAGGRDHWPQCWTIYFAGGGVKGGRVVGKSDEIGAYPAERPVKPPEVVATILKSSAWIWKRTCPARNRVRSRWWITARKPSRNCFSRRYASLVALLSVCLLLVRFVARGAPTRSRSLPPKITLHGQAAQAAADCRKTSRQTIRRRRSPTPFSFPAIRNIVKIENGVAVPCGEWQSNACL